VFLTTRVAGVIPKPPAFLAVCISAVAAHCCAVVSHACLVASPNIVRGVEPGMSCLLQVILYFIHYTLKYGVDQVFCEVGLQNAEKAYTIVHRKKQGVSGHEKGRKIICVSL